MQSVRDTVGRLWPISHKPRPIKGAGTSNGARQRRFRDPAWHVAPEEGLADALWWGGRQFLLSVRVTPATTAVVRSQPAAMSA